MRVITSKICCKLEIFKQFSKLFYQHHIWLTLLCLVTIPGCGGGGGGVDGLGSINSWNKTNSQATRGITAAEEFSPSYYLKLAQNYTKEELEYSYYLSLAAKKLLDLDKLPQANSITKLVNEARLATVNSDNNIDEKKLSEVRFLHRMNLARLALSNKQFSKVSELLDLNYLRLNIDNSATISEQGDNKIIEKNINKLIPIYKLLYQSQIVDKPITAVKTLVKLQAITTTFDSNINHKIWQILSNQSIKTLKRIRLTPDKTLTAWADLILLAKEENSDKFIQAIQKWQQQNSTHPANKLIPLNKISSNSLLLNKNINKIALLLPHKGPFANAAKAVQQGFMSGVFLQQPKPEIIIYDTYQKNINHVVSQAINQGADFIVGPLSKSNVNKLLNSYNQAVPILALNQATNKAYHPLILQLALTPESEADSITKRLMQDKHKNIAIVSANNASSIRLVEKLKDNWSKPRQNKVVAELSTNKVQAKQIKQLLQIDTSEKRILQVKELTKEYLRAHPKVRQDIDAIVLITDFEQTKAIRPLLSFYYASNLPIYAASSLNAPEQININLGKELTGITFCDIPMLISNETNYKKYRDTLKKIWPSQLEEYARLYAMGIDAYYIAKNYDKINVLGKLGLKANTGYLSLEDSNNLTRELSWAKIKENANVPLG